MIAVLQGTGVQDAGECSTHLRYARYINTLHGRSGHLWQRRFFSIPLDGPHMVFAARYVERNPVRAKMVRVAWRYRWPSAAAHCGAPDQSGLIDTRRPVPKPSHTKTPEMKGESEQSDDH